jgi:ABC-type phosphate transport system substrate-binding protein
VYFHYPYQKTDDITIELPLSWKVSSLAKPMSQDAKAAGYDMKTEDKGGNVHLTRSLRSDLMMIPKENYPALRAFFQLVRTGDEEQVVLQPGNAAAGN